MRIIFTITLCMGSALMNFLFSQGTAQDTMPVTELRGILLDAETKEALPYANIVIQRINKGSITNEVGAFSMDTVGVRLTDSISFLYIGYKTKQVEVQQLLENGSVYLEEDIQNLNKVFVFGSPPDPKTIVKKVIENKEKNYKRRLKSEQVFIRSRSTSDIKDYQLKYKKSSISQLDEKMIQEMEDKTPRHSTSYTDFLTQIYYSPITSDSDSYYYKTDPIRIVSLKEKDLDDLDQMEEIFEDVFSNTDKEEYWKFKTGIFSFKMDSADVTTSEDTTRPKDVVSYTQSRNLVNKAMRYSSLNSESEWDFLYATGKYNYELVGGTNVGPEDVYVIDFTPKSGGLFVGRMYVSVESYALIRADYEYDVGKEGTSIQILGFGYTERNFTGSILFERVDSTYQLRYCTKKKSTEARIDRSFALIKKKERFLIDKTIKEVKIGLNIVMADDESFEFVVLDRGTKTQVDYLNFQMPAYFPVHYVAQFDDDLWEGYAIIEPTKRMRDYKKR